MSTNPRGVAYDWDAQQLLCELCVEWTDFNKLYIDPQGQKWDICERCGKIEEEQA